MSGNLYYDRNLATNATNYCYYCQRWPFERILKSLCVYLRSVNLKKWLNFIYLYFTESFVYFAYVAFVNICIHIYNIHTYMYVHIYKHKYTYVCIWNAYNFWRFSQAMSNFKKCFLFFSKPKVVINLKLRRC